MTRGYTSTVVAPARTAAAIVAGAALAAVTLTGGPAWCAAVVGTAVAIIGCQLGVVRLAVTENRIAFGWGLWGRLRVVERRDLAAAEEQSLRGAQVYGIGVHTTARTTRLTVRSGPALCLRHVSGEVIRVSTPQPAAALALLHLTTPFPTREDDRS